MTLEQAVERVERFAAAITWANDEDREAVEAVLARAKEPRVYALKEVHRNAIESNMPTHGYQVLREALTAALSLEKPEEPFTVDDWNALNEEWLTPSQKEKKEKEKE